MAAENTYTAKER